MIHDPAQRSRLHSIILADLYGFCPRSVVQRAYREYYADHPKEQHDSPS